MPSVIAPAAICKCRERGRRTRTLSVADASAKSSTLNIGAGTARSGTARFKVIANQAQANPKTKKPRKTLNRNNLRGHLFGRRDWTRTNDPHHVKVVL